MAEAHEEFEAFNGSAAAVCLECFPAAADYASHAKIKVLFLFCIERDADCHVLWLGRCIFDCGAKVVHASRHDGRLDDRGQGLEVHGVFRLSASNLQEGGEILDGVDDGGASEEPGLLGLNEIAQVSASIAAAEAMCLIVDEAVPGLLNLEGLDKRCFPQGGLVANDTDIRCKGVCLYVRPPGVVGRVRGEDVDFGFQEDGFPLLNDCHRSDEKCVLAHLRLDEAGHLDGLAESHFVCEDSALALFLAFKHPANAGFLMLHVLELGPERHELFRLGCHQERCNTFCVSTSNDGRQGDSHCHSSRALAGRRGRFWLGRGRNGSSRPVLCEHV